MLTVFDIFGLTGVTTILVTYFLLQTKKLRVEQPIYSLLNILGAALILVSLTRAWNISAVLIEVFWILISLFGLYKSLKRK